MLEHKPGKETKSNKSTKVDSLRQRLHDSESEFDALFDAAVDAVIEIDARGHICRFNRAAEKIFGYSAEETLGHNVNILMPEPYHSEHDDYIRRYQKTGEARIIGIGREVTGRHKDGRCFPIELSVGEARIGSEPVYLGLIRDISQSKEIESQVQEMRERLEDVARVGAMGEMASGIAHELNQPLAAIASYARASRRILDDPQLKDNELLQETLDKIAAQAERAGEIIRRMRGLIKRSTGEKEVVSIALLIEQLMKIAELEMREHGFRLEVDIAADVPEVHVDGLQIQQVLLNLIRNAVEAMREASVGEVIAVTGRLRNGQVEVSVSDRGPGIADDVLESVFEPFYTTKRDGLGMGLALCAGIMHSHGGELFCRNNRYGGATFTMRLPPAES